MEGFSIDALIDRSINTEVDNFKQIDLSKIESQTMDDVFGDYTGKTIIIPTDIAEPFRELIYKESDTLNVIAQDSELFTRFKNDSINFSGEEDDVWSLENFRVFSKNSFKNKGIIFSENTSYLIERFPYLVKSSLYTIKNTSFTNRYVYPICLPDGKVYTYMGYSIESRTNSLIPKYEISSQTWVDQSKIIGNMESLSLYEGKIIYCVEGYFDSVRINDEFGKKSICILGSKLTKEKRDILYQLKLMGHILVYIPDEDDAGSIIANDNIWDYVYHIPTRENKDIDAYVRETYKETYKKYGDDFNNNLHSYGKLNIKFHELGLNERALSICRSVKAINFAM